MKSTASHSCCYSTDMYTSLFSDASDSIKKMIRDCLAIIVGSCASDVLPPFLEGRKWGQVSEELCAETKIMSKTNIGPEHVFGLLDRSYLLKPSDSTGHHEGVITYGSNKSGQWLLQHMDSPSIISKAINMGRQLAKRLSATYLGSQRKAPCRTSGKKR